MLGVNTGPIWSNVYLGRVSFPTIDIVPFESYELARGSGDEAGPPSCPIGFIGLLSKLLSNQEWNSILLEIEAAKTCYIVTRIGWRAWRDSNPRHPVPKTGALSAELQAH